MENTSIYIRITPFACPLTNHAFTDAGHGRSQPCALPARPEHHPQPRCPPQPIVEPGVHVHLPLPGHRPQALVASLNPRVGRRLYNILTDLAWLPGCISPQHHWKQRLKTLLLQHTIDPQPMGFPAGWEQLAIWKEGTE